MSRFIRQKFEQKRLPTVWLTMCGERCVASVVRIGLGDARCPAYCLLDHYLHLM